MALQFTAQSVFVAPWESQKSNFLFNFPKSDHCGALTVLLPRIGGLGVNGVFWAEPISNLVGGCASFFTMLLTILPELKDEKKPEEQK